MVTNSLPELGSVHIMGIGGAGMSGIAQILASRGVSVSGCDAKESRRAAALRALGINVEIGHNPDHLMGVNSVVVSTAIPAVNRERVAAGEVGIPVLSRAKALGVIMAGFRGIAITGTHGKTTTTSMFTVALQNCGVDPSFAIGSEINESGANAHLGSGICLLWKPMKVTGHFSTFSPR